MKKDYSPTFVTVHASTDSSAFVLVSSPDLFLDNAQFAHAARSLVGVTHDSMQS